MGHDFDLNVYDFFFSGYSPQVKAMVEGRDRRPEMGFKLAMELKNADSESKRGRRQI